MEPVRRERALGDTGDAAGKASGERRAWRERPGSVGSSLHAPRSPLPSARRVARSRTRIIKPAVFLLALLPFAYIVHAAATDPDALGANPINEVEHFTGQWALRFLLLTLAVSPVRKLTGWGEAAKYRRMLGLFAFFYATVHLSTWVGVDMELDASDMWHDVVKHKYITIGMAAWLMLLPLAVTSTKGWIRRLGGQRWRRLHTLTYVAATFGVVHYFWAVKKDISQPLLFAAILGALLGYRAWTARRKGERVRDARQRQ